jgi:hypothetical protein
VAVGELAHAAVGGGLALLVLGGAELAQLLLAFRLGPQAGQ